MTTRLRIASEQMAALLGDARAMTEPPGEVARVALAAADALLAEHERTQPWAWDAFATRQAPDGIPAGTTESAPSCRSGFKSHGLPAPPSGDELPATPIGDAAFWRGQAEAAAARIRELEACKNGLVAMYQSLEERHAKLLAVQLERARVAESPIAREADAQRRRAEDAEELADEYLVQRDNAESDLAHTRRERDEAMAELARLRPGGDTHNYRTNYNNLIQLIAEQTYAVGIGETMTAEDRVRRMCSALVDARAELARLKPPPPMREGTTHWEDCWRWHNDCAVAELERLTREAKP